LCFVIPSNPIIETQQIETQNKTVPSYASDETNATGLENSTIPIADTSNQAQNQPAVDPAIAQVNQTSPDDQVIDAPANISATDTATPIPTASLPTATAAPIPTDTPTSTPTVPPTPTTLPDWVFMNTQVYPDPAGNGLLMFGNFINNTGLAQEIMSLSALFYDEQGQVIAETRTRDAYWPGFVVAPNGSMPFELTVADIENAGDFVLTVEAKPSGELPQENFEFSDLNQKDEGVDYCVSGEFNNPGEHLRNYLIITAIFYNSEDKVVNFGHYSVYYPEGVEADPGFDFDLCADGFNQDVARYELQAWGL
ncbi:MAG: hypothetical protein KDJ97_34815, partial [Anaerolineae bacterium]|nr:hypothetical protein [Anaerolineae bacterium]